MALTTITEPAIEPIALADLKNDIRVDSDLTADDFLISAHLASARRYIEKVVDRALITQTLELTMDAWPTGDRFELPRPPLQSVTSIKYYDTDHAEYTLSSDDYYLDTASSPGRVVLEFGSTWPAVALRSVNGIIIRFVAGYGDEESDVPEHLAHAVRLLAGHWYENRGAVETGGAQPKEIPLGVNSLLWLDRVVTM